MVVQDRWRVTLINSGDADTARFTILPFLQREGVNQVEAALAANWSISPSQGWLQILEQLPVETLYGSAANGNSSDRLLETLRDRDGSYQLLAPGQPQSIGAATVRLIQTNPLLMQLEIEDREWLLLGDLDPSQQNQLTQSKRLPATAILWWSGSYLSEAVLDAIQPQVAIAYSYSIDGNTADRLREAGVQIYQLTANGALQWTPGNQFETILDTGDRDSPLL
jgi:competence protein ComEC